METRNCVLEDKSEAFAVRVVKRYPYLQRLRAGIAIEGLTHTLIANH